MFDQIPVPGRLISEMSLFCRAYPLGRPRMRKDRSAVYQPLENQAEMREEMNPYNRPEPIDCPMILVARLFYQKPSYKPVEHVCVYDVDNLTKAIADNLVDRGIISDDRLILRMDVSKSYSAEDYLIVRLHEVEYETEKVPRGLLRKDSKVG